MAAADDRLTSSLEDVKALEMFARELILEVLKRPSRPAHGEDLSKYAEEIGRKVPDALRGVPITWDSKHDFANGEFDKDSVLVVVGPGHPDAVGLTIGCARWGKWKICLECGWLYCRVVIKRRF
jgi:hypothetical protein